MLQTTALSARAFEVVVASPITGEEMRASLTQLESILDTTPRVDILTDVRGHVLLNPALFLEELRHFPLMFRMIRALDRVAVVADQGWIRAIAKAESHLIPGLEYQVYDRNAIDHARAWILRQTDQPHPSG